MGDLELGVVNTADRATQLVPSLGPSFGSDYLLWADASHAGKPIHGLIGFGYDADGVWGESVRFDRGWGRIGTGSGSGVFGRGTFGVFGEGTKAGVYGHAGAVDASADQAVGVFGRATSGFAVLGDNRMSSTRRSATAGCAGFTDNGTAGVLGVVYARRARRPRVGNAAVYGYVRPHPRRQLRDGVAAICGSAAVVQRQEGVRMYDSYAGLFNGPVAISGELTVFGPNPKSAAVRHPDGSHRRLYCLEAPESLFEDVGRARLRGGTVTVRLDPQFAALIRTDDYHVFLTAEGECQALSVVARRRNGFTVRETGNGRSGAPFSYRIVAKRRDVNAPRLERVTPPATQAPRLIDSEPAEMPMPPQRRGSVPRVNPARPRNPAGGPVPKPARAAARGSRERPR